MKKLYRGRGGRPVTLDEYLRVLEEQRRLANFYARLREAQPHPLRRLYYG